MNENSLGKFQNLLRTLFQFDCADLDFGIYRILNYKRDQVEGFIVHQLPQIVDQAFAGYAREDLAAVEEELKKTRQEIIENLGEQAVDESGRLLNYHNTKLGQQYLRLQEEQAQYRVAEELKTRVYNDLYTFFSRYYEDGDFISKRRYGRRETYAIPYNGEEVVLYWANQDQYYVKTDDRFKTYRFKVDAYTVSFELRNAASDQNGKRYFVLAEENPVAWDAPRKTLTIAFKYRPLTEEEEKEHGRTEQQKPQDSLNEKAEKTILEIVEDSGLKAALARVEGSNGRSLLLKHLTRFTRRNTTDFFVHKDLRGFLLRELDFFIKNEVLLLDELIWGEEKDLRRQILRARVVRRVAEAIIEFLAQVEDFQKKLWEKRKFVIRTEYCATIGDVPEELWDEILKNEHQVEEWRQLYALDDILKEQKLYRLDKEFLRMHPTLVVDTRHFPEDFKWGLLASFDDLDEVVDGLLIHSENWQALNLLREKYRQRVKTVYIDPPYNTGNDEFLYRDSYQHSSWLTMMENRLNAATDFLMLSGLVFVNIDEREQARLEALLGRIFRSENSLGPFIWLARAGKAVTERQLQVAHEYILCAGESVSDVKFELVEKTVTGCRYHDERGRYQREMLRQWGGQHDRREDRPTMYFPIPCPFGGEVYPKRPDGSEGCWRASREQVEKMLENGDLEFVRDERTGEITVYRKVREGTVTLSAPSNILDDCGNSATATREIKSLFGYKAFDAAKPVNLPKRCVSLLAEGKAGYVLDFFAGSGTTGHAVINLNREDGGRRKFILVEMADYFDTVLLPRIKKVTFTPEWKDGKPKRLPTKDEIERSPRIVKYLNLESYEDTLNNLKLTRDQEGQMALDLFGDEYLLKYMLEFETQGSPSLLNPERFKCPFAYKLKIQEGDEIIERPVDLVETFNYLVGLQVRKMREFRDDGRLYRAVLGEKDGKRVVVVWRSAVDLDNSEEALMRDKAFIEATVLPGLLGEARPDRLVVNGCCLVRNAEAIEPEFHRLMFAPVGV